MDHDLILDIRDGLAKLDVRVSILETRTQSEDMQLTHLRESMARIQDEVNEMNQKIMSNLTSIHDDLLKHIIEEQKDKTSLLRAQIGVIVSVILTFAILGIEIWSGKWLFPIEPTWGNQFNGYYHQDKKGDRSSHCW